MKAFKFEIILQIDGVEPLCLTVTGLRRTHQSLTNVIRNRVNDYNLRKMGITGWRIPTYQELRRVQRDNITEYYVITFKNAAHDIIFRLSRAE